MNERDRSTISQADSYEAIGRFWDEHDLADYWDQTESVDDASFEVEGATILFALDTELAGRLAETAREHGVSPETLLNLWVQEKLEEGAS